MNIIEVEGVVFDYPGKRALDDVSFAIPGNSITALVGPNGAGKTTLMRCLAALDTPLRGRITLNNIDVLAEPRLCHRQVGYLSDFFGLYNELTVEQCLRFVAGSHAVKEPGTAMDHIMEELGLQGFRHTPAGALSRGYRQRLGIAQAIIHTPGVLILDEPASGLDPEARHELARLLVRLRAAGMTVLVSSHILAELGEYSTHMLIIEDGHIVDFCAIGDTDSGLTQLQIVLAAPDPRLPGLLQADPDFGIEHASDREAVGSLAGDAAMLAGFLQRLVQAGLPVCRFEVLGEDMQDVYLSRIRARREQRGAPADGTPPK